MGNLKDKERKTILDLARKIHTYKLMQARGYEGITRKIRDERTKRFLKDISLNEVKGSEFWAEKIRELEGYLGRSGKAFILALKVSLMMRILGRRGFFEWTIIAEDEILETLSVQAENISDIAASEKWTRIVTDECLHVNNLKKEVLGMEAWEMQSSGGVRDIIFGANDGLVSILALVVGVYGAVMESHPILIAGIAGAVAGAISMGAGAYLSSKSEKEVTERENRNKGIKKKMTPEEERDKLIDFYQIKGFKKQEAAAIADRVALELEMRSDYTIGEEVGLTSEESWPPVKAATLTGLSFAIVSLIPILPFAFLEVTPAVIIAVIASIASLFLVGASKATFTRKGWFKSGLEMMGIGILAAAATYVIGLVIPV